MRLFLTALILSFVSLSAQAQISGGASTGLRVITLEEALRIGLEQNLALRLAENSVSQSRAIVTEQKNAYLPTLSFSAGTGQSYGRTVEEARIVNETNESFDFGMSANINLWDGGAKAAGISSARAALVASRAQRDRSEQTVVFNVATGYLNALAQQEQVRVLESALADQRAQLEQVLALIAAGSRPESDRYQQEAQVAQAELDVLNAEQAAQLAEVQLVQTLQLDPFGQYEFVIPELDGLDVDAPEMQAYAIATLLQQALDQRPDVQAQQAAIRAAEADVRIAKARRMPSINLRGQYGTAWSSAFQIPTFDGQGNVTGLETVPVFDQFDQRRGGGVSLSLSFPLFDAFSVRNSTQRARLRVESEKLALADLRQNVGTQVRQAYLDYLSYQKQVEVGQVQVESARRALDAAQQRYQAGAGTLLEVTQAQTALTQAQSRLLQAQYSFIFQEKLIDYYLGALDPANISFD